MKIIDSETAARWGREAQGGGDEGSFLAGRPTPILLEHLVDKDQLVRERRLDRVAVLAEGVSLLGIGVVAATGLRLGLALAAGFGVLSLAALLASLRSRRASSCRVDELRHRSARAAS